MAFLMKADAPADLVKVNAAIEELQTRWLAFQQARRDVERAVSNARVNIIGNNSPYADSIYGLGPDHKVRVDFSV